MYSTAWMNQFEAKDTCIEFLINNVSSQGNNVKTKLNLNMEEICRDCTPNVLLRSEYVPYYLGAFSIIIN